jgi:WD40 repeat protein/serine/threonine protein kinase
VDPAGSDRLVVVERKGPAEREAATAPQKPVMADGSVVGADKAAAFDETVAPRAAGLDETMAAAPTKTPDPGFDQTMAGPPPGPRGLEQTVAGGPTLASRSGDEATASQPASRASTGMIRSGTSKLGRSDDDIDLPIVDDANYERYEEFARGGLGRIVRAKDRRTGRVVALKEMLGNADETARRFAREARVTAILEHPAIVPVYEFGRWPSGEPFFAMKLVSGQSLQQVTAECKTMAARLGRLSVIIAVAEALAYAHGQRVIHRDLKPANVLVGSFGETVVIDWGLAKLIDEADASVVGAPAPRTSEAVIEAGSIGERTMDGSVLGTPSYMPPEQALGNKADERADVYAIGAMLYQLITGVTPFSDKQPKHVAELLTMVERDRPTPVALLAPTAPPDLVTIIEKAMARDKSERYPTAKELAEDLERFTNGQLVQAHQYDWKALAKRWLKRHRATVTVAAALVAVLIAGAVYSVRSIIHERDAADARRAEAETAKGIATTETTRARASLATALVQKGKSAEQKQRWADAAMYYAASRVQADPGTARWLGGVAESKAIVAHARHEGHEEPVTASAISKDGERVVTVDTAGEVRIWKRGDGTLLATRKLADQLWSVAYSPTGREIAVGDDGGTIHRFAPTLDPVGKLEGHKKRVWSLAYSPDGALLASGGEDATARLWTVATGASKVLDKGHTQRVYSVAFSPDGKRLASGSDDRTLWLWDVASGKGTQRGAQENGGIRTVEFTRSGSDIAAGGWDFDLKLWPAGGGNAASWNDKMSVHDIAVSPDARVLISAGDTLELRFWEVSTRNLVTVIDLPGGRTNTVTMSDDGKWLVTAGDNRLPIVWNIAALPRLIDAVGHRNGIAELRITNDGTRVVTIADDHTLRVWNLADGREQLQISLPTQQGKRMYCSSPHLSKDGVISAGCEDKLIRRWDLTGRELPGIPTSVYLRIASLSPDDKTLAAGHMKGILGLFEIATGKAIIEKTIHDHQIYGVSYGKSGLLATGSLDNTVKVWSPALELLASFRIDGDDGVLRSAISADGNIVIAGAQDGTLYAWELASKKLLAKHKAHTGPIWGLSYSNDKRFVYTAGEDGTFLVWDALAWKVVEKLDGGEGGGGPLAVSPDGKTAVTGYRNGGMVVWDLETRKVRYRVGGNARDKGSCSDLEPQRWVDDAHRAIVQGGCTEGPAPYFERIRRFAHKKIVNDVDVEDDW